jgi:hypothetical protein
MGCMWEMDDETRIIHYIESLCVKSGNRGQKMVMIEQEMCQLQTGAECSQAHKVELPIGIGMFNKAWLDY